MLRRLRQAARRDASGAVSLAAYAPNGAAAHTCAAATHIGDVRGHSSISITGDTYGHTSDDTARAAVDQLSNALGI